MATKYWRVESMATNGWNITDPRLDVKLTKDQARTRLEELIAEGYNPTDSGRFLMQHNEGSSDLKCPISPKSTTM